ncbi:hypothetical protein [Cupriavidus sp. RAF12]|uniref:hypothetical protein n=1 Tax=Cupriavidus sp. RAF12 TaxID=3233050 RepID=UPI003F8E634B
MGMPPLSNVSSPRGAPMGRRNLRGDAEEGYKFWLRRLDWVDGDYDPGGAYWGRSGGDYIYRAVSTDGEVEQFVRAKTRAAAKDQLLEDYPAGRFFN